MTIQLIETREMTITEEALTIEDTRQAKYFGSPIR